MKALVSEKLQLVFLRVDNIVGKRENAGNKHFWLFPQYFLKVSYTGSVIIAIVRYMLRVKVRHLYHIIIFHTAKKLICFKNISKVVNSKKEYVLRFVGFYQQIFMMLDEPRLI